MQEKDNWKVSLESAASELVCSEDHVRALMRSAHLGADMDGDAPCTRRVWLDDYKAYRRNFGTVSFVEMDESISTGDN